MFQAFWYLEFDVCSLPLQAVCGPEGNRTPFSSMPWIYTTGVLRAPFILSQYFITQNAPLFDFVTVP